MRIDKPEASSEDLRGGLAKLMLIAYTLRTVDKDGETIRDEHLDISMHYLGNTPSELDAKLHQTSIYDFMIDFLVKHEAQV
jgi:hypothetical protein